MLKLTEQITKLTEEAGGNWAVSLFDLDTADVWERNEHQVFYGASIIKIPIMIAAFAAALRQQIDFHQTRTLRQEDMVAGCGVLQHLTPGTSFTIRDLVTLMIIQSDNTATNMLIDLLSTEKIQQTMKEIGLEQSKFHHKMMLTERDPEKLNSITAHEMTGMLKRMHAGRIISPNACSQMLDILKKQQIRHSLPAKLRESDDINDERKQWELANKTGNIPGVRHDIGIFYVGKRSLAVSVLSERADDLISLETFGKIGWAIYDFLSETQERNR